MICPSCNKEFARMSKGGCPNCKISLFRTGKGQVRLVSDKETVEEILTLLDEFSKKKTGLNTKEFSRTPSEWTAAYGLLDVTKQFTSSIKEPGSEKDLMLRVLKSKIKDPWWYKNLTHVYFLRRKWYSYLTEEYRLIKQERTKLEADNRRASNAISNQVILNGLF